MTNFENSLSPEVTLGLHGKQTILTLNNEFISIPDTTHDQFINAINLAKDPMQKRLIELRNLYKNRKNKSPKILVGRLAMIGSEANALEEGSVDMLEVDDSLLSVDDLSRSYKPFWTTLEKASFAPAIFQRAVKNDDVLSGIWLGVRRPSDQI